MIRPDASEFAEFYHSYAALVHEDDVLGVLSVQSNEMRALFDGVPEEKGAFAYDTDKWTAKQVLGHVLDTERILAYRLLRIARGDKTPIEGFEQEDYIKFARFNKRSITDLIDEFELVRRSNMLFMNKLNGEDWMRYGTANNNRFSARAIALIMAGHVRHHLCILNDKYLLE